MTTSWLLDDEVDPGAAIVADLVRQDTAFVPQLWHLEVRNALLVALRRGRIDNNQFHLRIRSLSELLVSTDSEPDFSSALDLAVSHNLSFYDAIYLELAHRRQAGLATLDDRLRRAASAEGLGTLP